MTLRIHSITHGARHVCCVCGSADICSILVGSESVVAPGGIVIQRGEATRAWCLRHWPTARGHQPSLMNLLENEKPGAQTPGLSEHAPTKRTDEI